jgi:hypothetical protein
MPTAVPTDGENAHWRCLDDSDGLADLLTGRRRMWVVVTDQNVGHPSLPASEALHPDLRGVRVRP